MSESTGPGESENAGTGQDPYVERLRPDPSQPPQRVIVLSGLLGNSDRPGYQRLYFNRELDYYAEFKGEDVLHTERIPADEAPLPGLEATRVTIRRDATVDYTRTKRAQPLDEFDLDLRLAGRARPPRVGLEPETWEAECPGPSMFAACETDFTCVCGDTVQITICRGRTCIDVCTDDTCRTLCDQATCETCRTRCGQETCQTCQTCQTQCNQATCQTCQTRCGQATCQTCRTRCGQETCHTCETVCEFTCNPHVFTCGPDPQCA
jgi:hypothetical protein